MGAVWLADDEVLGREVAVKRVRTVSRRPGPDLMRAQREAKLAAKLHHLHVVAVFDFVTEQDEQWLVMEYVDGADLAVLAEHADGLLPGLKRRRCSLRSPRLSRPRTRREWCTATSSPPTSW